MTSLTARHPLRRVASRTRAAILLPLAAACWESPPAGHDAVRYDTLGGVVHVTTDGDGWTDAEAWRIGPARVRIGRIEGGGPDEFGQIASVAVGPTGRLFVADGQALEIRVFDAAGAYLYGFGRKGEGPGEFEAVDGLLALANAILVRDPRLFRVSRFAPDGTFESSHRLERGFLIFSDGTTFWSDDDGRVYDRVTLSMVIGDPERIGLITYEPDMSGVDTTELASRDIPRIMATRGELPVGSVIAPFAARPVVTVNAKGQLGWTSGDEHQIVTLNRSGDTLRVFGRDARPEPLSREEGEVELDVLREWADEMFGSATLGEAELPTHKPVATRLIADAAGNWWLGRYRSERDPDDPTAHVPTSWDVYEPDGRWLGSVEVPPIRVMQIGADFVAGIEVDDLGVNYAMVYTLEKP